MKFNLKFLLVGVCVLGAVFGLMGRLYVESPETFLQGLEIIGTIGPFLLGIGTILLFGWFGVRPTSVETIPTCCQCQHNLTTADLSPTCPVCGADLAARKRVLLALRPRRRWGLLIGGVVLLIFPLLIHGAIAVLWPTRDPLPLLSNDRLILSRLPKQVNKPWVWKELVNRLNKQALSPAEVDQCIEKLVAFMTATSPSGWNQFLSCQKKFVDTAVGRQMISEKVFLDLCDAFFGTQPTVQSRRLTATEKTGFPLNLQYGCRNAGLGVSVAWDVKEVLLDGTQAKLRRVNRLLYHWLGYCDNTLKPGDHEVRIEIECAFIDDSNLVGVNVSNLPIDQWPAARKRWSTTLSVPLKVEPLELK